MIVEAILTAIQGLLKIVFGWITLPALPDSIQAVLDELFVYLEGGIGILSVFIDFNMVKVLLPLLIAIINFEHLYDMTMFIIKKLPFSIE